MDIFTEIARASSEKDLPCLLIGGHAVNAYGYARTTLDVDLLIPEGALAGWMGMLDGLGYRCFHETDAFAQYSPPEGSSEFPVDLMVVGEDTYAKLATNAEAHTLGNQEFSLPRVLDLIALKLHALHSPARAAKGRDLPDILALARRHGIEPTDHDFQDILARYAPEEIRAEIERQLR